MKKFLFKLFLFALIIVAIDISYGAVCHYIRSNVKAGMTHMDMQAAYETKADVLVFGSSRARRHYDTRILADSLDMTVFNCGYNSMGIHFFYPRLSQIIERYNPKVIIYDITPLYDYQKSDDAKVTINNLKPFFHHKAAADQIYDYNPIEWIKCHSATYRYHGQIPDYIADNKNKEVFINGYAPLNGVHDIKVKKHAESNPDYSKLDIFQKFIDDCKERNITLYFVISPYYKNDIKDASQPFKDLAAKNSIPVFDHFYDSEFVNDSTLYWDPSHLNSKGAKMFTNIITSEILRN